MCMFAGLLLSSQTTVSTVSRQDLNATATSFRAFADGDELRVISTRLISQDQGMLVYGNTSVVDSMVIEARFLAHLQPGDILSDSEGTIER